MLALAELLDEVGFPAGVVNVVTTREPAALVAPLLADPRLRKLTFTGSTGVGRELVRGSATQLLRVSMELGGNAPFLVFADADLEAAVDGAMVAKLRNMGEACTAANRFLVHHEVAAEFVERLAARMSAEVVGPGTTPGVTVGPLIDDAARA
jgi:succinate-semialdehyde dehydrogenase/glutarate-semialdehyde dehydrogenase